MKQYTLILSLIAIIPLTACQVIREPAPGNELAELINQKDFQNVAASHPDFASYCIRTVTKLEIEQAWANHKKMEAVKARYKKINPPRAMIVPLPPILTNTANKTP